MYKKLTMLSCLLSLCVTVQAMNKDAKYYLKFHDEKISITRAGLERLRVCANALDEYEKDAEESRAEFVFDLDSWLRPHVKKAWVKKLEVGDVRFFAQFAMGNVEVGVLGGARVLSWIHCADILNATRFGDFKPDRDLLTELITGLAKKLNEEDARLICDKKGLWWDILVSGFTPDIMNDLQKIIFAGGPRVVQTIDKPFETKKGNIFGLIGAELSDGRFACTGVLASGVFIIDLATGKLHKITIAGSPIPYSMIGLSDKNFVVCGQKMLSVFSSTSEREVDESWVQQVDERVNPVLVALEHGKFALSLWELEEKESIVHILGSDGSGEFKQEKQFTVDGKISSMLLVPGVGLAVSFHDTPEMLIIDPDTGKKLLTLTAPDDYTDQTFFVKPSGALVSCSMSAVDSETSRKYIAEIDMWNPKTGKLLKRTTDLDSLKWTHVQLLPNGDFIGLSADSQFSIGIEELKILGAEKQSSSLLVLHDGTVVTTPVGRKVQISEVLDFYEGLNFEQAVIVKSLRQVVVQEREAQLKKMMNITELREIFGSFSKTRSAQKILNMLNIKMPEIKQIEPVRHQGKQLTVVEQMKIIGEIKANISIIRMALSGELNEDVSIPAQSTEIEGLLKKLDQEGRPSEELTKLKKEFQELKKFLE